MQEISYIAVHALIDIRDGRAIFDRIRLREEFRFRIIRRKYETHFFGTGHWNNLITRGGYGLWHGSGTANAASARTAGSSTSTPSAGAGSTPSAAAAGCSRDASTRRTGGACNGTAGFQPGSADRKDSGNARSSRGDDGGT